MNIFDNTTGKAHKFQGAIGEARCIYEMTRKGYVVYKPLAELSKSDLVVETPDGQLLKVQVKTTRQIKPSGGYEVMLVTTGGNTKVNTRQVRQAGDYDLLFVMTESGRCWIIPDSALGTAANSIIVGATKYTEYEVR